MKCLLFNKTKGKRICERIKTADSSWKRFKGLMLEKQANFNYALIFDLGRESRYAASIHMLFVFFPIDVVYLNSKKEVVEIKQNLKPWSLNYTPKTRAKYFVELPKGKSEGIEVGEELVWKK